jgi:hypothetical protein
MKDLQRASNPRNQAGRERVRNGPKRESMSERQLSAWSKKAK